MSIMSELPFDLLRADIASLRHEVAAVRSEVAADISALRTEVAAGIAALRGEVAADVSALRIDIVRLEAKIDSKPSLMAMFTGIVVVVFGMAGIIGTTVATLNALGFLAR